MEQLYDKQNKTPFSITFISLDKERHKGGDIIRLDSCFVPRSEHVSTSTPKTTMPNKKSANHIQNNTINVAVTGSDRLVKLHIDLITEFNKKRVIW